MIAGVLCIPRIKFLRKDSKKTSFFACLILPVAELRPLRFNAKTYLLVLLMVSCGCLDLKFGTQITNSQLRHYMNHCRAK